MRTFGLISAGVALLGLLGYFFLKDAMPAFIVPLILISGILAIILLSGSLVISKVRFGKKYQCVNCGTILTGGNPIRYANVCPNCGGNVFA